MRRTFLIPNISAFQAWETCFHSLMEKSDLFRIIFQVHSDAFDADGLNAGKQEFLKLPSITVSPYEGMENSIEVTGELNMVARKVFQTLMTPSFHGWKSALWSFQFLKGNDVMLRVEDFTVGLLFLEESEVEDLLAQGVDGINALEIDSFSEGVHPSDIEVAHWNKDELSSLRPLFHQN